MIRVGNREYARTNHSFGLTTLENQHVHAEGGELKFEFTGKSGKAWKLGLRDRRVARIVRACQELPGQHLFEYRDEAARCTRSHPATSTPGCARRRRRHHRQGLPHLGRNGVGGAGAA